RSVRMSTYPATQEVVRMVVAMAQVSRVASLMLRPGGVRGPCKRQANRGPPPSARQDDQIATPCGVLPHPRSVHEGGRPAHERADHLLEVLAADDQLDILGDQRAVLPLQRVEVVAQRGEAAVADDRVADRADDVLGG